MINYRHKGFTLIELLVVISIIGLLASVVLVSLNSARRKARDAKRIGDLNQMAKAFELFFNDNNSYPTNNQAAATYGTLIDCTGGGAGCAPGLVPKYITYIPTAPTPEDGACQPSSYPYNNYRYAGTGVGVNQSNNYTITFCLGAQTGSLGAGAHTLTQAGFQ
jgi:prepilin-type N-terminal cleavage/methylation domain-containing protein